MTNANTTPTLSTLAAYTLAANKIRAIEAKGKTAPDRLYKEMFRLEDALKAASKGGF